MALIDSSELIGKQVIYFDYMGIERHGNIVAFEPSNDPEQLYLYIADEDEEENIHDLQTSPTTVIMYAEMRLSGDVILDESED